jgi:hypothetical protein
MRVIRDHVVFNVTGPAAIAFFDRVAHGFSRADAPLKAVRH